MTISLAEVRSKCGSWDATEKECEEDFPEECPFHDECEDTEETDA